MDVNEKITVIELAEQIRTGYDARYGTASEKTDCLGKDAFEAANLQEFMMNGRRKGWLEDIDTARGQRLADRQTTARIVHQFLRCQMGEADEPDWGDARNLKDLYDCHTCVNHIAQVYAKGIMREAAPERFAGRQQLSREEASEIVERMLWSQKRLTTKAPPGDDALATELTCEEAVRRYLAAVRKQETAALLVDVRSYVSYEESHIKGAVCVPMAEVIRNPGGITPDLETELYFYCEQGYQSNVCANCMAEHGYKRVFYFSWEKEEVNAAERKD